MKFTKTDLPNIYKNYPKEFEKFNEILKLKAKNKENQAEYFAYLKSFDDNLVNNPKVLKPFISNLVELDFSSKDLQNIWTFANIINELFQQDESKLKDFIENNEILSDDYAEFLQENDYYDLDAFSDYLHESLRNDGLDSNWIYLVKPYLDLPDVGIDFVQVNVYANSLNARTEEQVLIDYVWNSEGVKKYLDSFNGSKFELDNINKI